MKDRKEDVNSDRQTDILRDTKAGRRAGRRYQTTVRCHTSLKSVIVPNSRLPARSAPLAAD